MAEAVRARSDANVAGPELLLGDIILARGVCAAEAAEKGVSFEAPCRRIWWSTARFTCSATTITTTTTAADMEAREVRALARLGIADPYAGARLMATRQDDEGGSRLWRGMRHLIFGDEAEPTLRDQIEEAIEEAEDERARSPATSARPSGRCSSNLLHFGDQTAGDICVTRGDIIAVPVDDQLRRAGPAPSPTPATAACPSMARASMKWSA